MENNLKIRMFRDGTSLVIYIDDCDASMEDLLKGLLKPAIAPESRLEEEVPTTTEPVTPKGWYGISGKTVTENLQEMGLKGYANIRYILDRKEGDEITSSDGDKWILTKENLFKPSEKHEVETILQEYIHEYFSTVDADAFTVALDEKNANDLLKILDSMIDDEMRNKAKNISGCSSYEEFRKSGTLQQKQALIVSVIDKIKLVD